MAWRAIFVSKGLSARRNGEHKCEGREGREGRVRLAVPDCAGARACASINVHSQCQSQVAA